MIELVSFDVGGTLATASGESFTTYMGARSSLPRDTYLERARNRLLTISHFDEVSISDLCRYLGVDRSVWPDAWSPAPLVPLAGAVEVIDEIASNNRVVTLSNVCSRDVTEGEVERMFPRVSAVFRSCDIGATKPDRSAFMVLAETFAIDPSSILHIGDNWRCDVEGARAVGAHAAYVGKGIDDVISGLDIRQLFVKLRDRRLV